MKNKMKPIKSFIYLDQDKMYSISSQLFEGMTQYILQEDASLYGEENEQKGKFLSGRFMADMMFQQHSKSEMKYLHDFAFNLFEEELVNRKLLYDVKPTDGIGDIPKNGFIRIKGKIIFSDSDQLLSTLENFNDLGKAMGMMFAGITESQILEGINIDTKDREKKNKQKQYKRIAKNKIEEVLRNQGLMLDNEKISNLTTVLNYAYHDEYEIGCTIDGSDIVFTSIVNKDLFKENGKLLVSKYSRLTEKEFTIVGIVAQAGEAKANTIQPTNKIKQVMQDLFEKLAGLEEQFCGRSDNECIIDPIAIFTEL
jgi:hypothetical protein